MASLTAASGEEFYRIQKLPPYVFAVINEMKAKARAAQQDVVDLGMGNPDGSTPEPIVKKLIEAVRNPRNHRYSMSRGIPRSARGNRQTLSHQIRRRAGSGNRSDRHHRRQGRAGPSALRRDRPGRRRGLSEPRLSHPSIRRHHGRRPRVHAPHADARRVSQPTGTSVQHVLAQAEDDPDFVSAQPHHALRGSAVLPRHRGAGRAARHHDRA